MSKKVRYICKKEGNPSNELIDGQEYEVIYEQLKGESVKYILKDIKGEFDSSLFEDSKPAFLALGTYIPNKGEYYKCYRIEFKGKEGQIYSWETNLVKEVVYIGSNIYKVVTNNNMYLVLISSNC